MAILGFILGALILMYFTFACVALPYVSQLGGGLRGWGIFWWAAFCIFTITLWWLLLDNSPFTVTVGL